jgi:hypothetical protein
MQPNDEGIDPFADAAIQDLCDRLSASLSQAILDGDRHALRDFEAQLGRRHRELEEAVAGARAVLDGLGPKMQQSAGAAMAEGVRDEVLPVLADHAARLHEAAEERISVLSAQLAAFHQEDADAFAATESRLASAVRESTKALDHSVGHAITTSLAAVHATFSRLQKELGSLAADMRSALDRIATKTDQGLVSLATLHEQTTQVAERQAAHENLLATSRREAAEGVLSIHRAIGRRFRHFVVLQVLTILLTLASFLAAWLTSAP